MDGLGHPQARRFVASSLVAGRASAVLDRRSGVRFGQVSKSRYPSSPFHPFLGEGSTTKIDYRKKLVPLF